jgi:hypothetical protein
MVFSQLNIFENTFNFLVVLGMEPMALHMLGQCSITENFLTEV